MASLGYDLIERRPFIKTRRKATLAVFEFVESWYKNRRLHSVLAR